MKIQVFPSIKKVFVLKHGTPDELSSNKRLVSNGHSVVYDLDNEDEMIPAFVLKKLLYWARKGSI